jgi:hypothetical protein
MNYTKEKHELLLKAIFPDAIDGFIDELYELEAKVCKANEDYCNGLIDGYRWEFKHKVFEGKLEDILNPINPDVLYVNGDPRGYGLKIESEEKNRLYQQENINIYSDMGGYGILAPELN